MERSPVAKDAIDEETGMVDVYTLLPNPGDSVMIVNCGDRFEVRQHSWVKGEGGMLMLTEEDIDKLTEGRIVWN
jgi:hypothetical protein